jgi:uncharacterized membrane protein YdbT with pleckstrin-like domain
MSYVDENLLPGERVVYRARLHPIIYTWAIVLAIVGAAAAVLLVASIMFGVNLIKSSSSEFAVTNRRVVIKVGIVRRHTVELLLQQIEGIGVDQTVVGRMLNLGSIVVIGTGGTKEEFTNIANPLEFRHQVQAQTAGGYEVAAPAGAAPVAAGGTYCGSCGTQSPQAASFCYRCGKPLVSP